MTNKRKDISEEEFEKLKRIDKKFKLILKKAIKETQLNQCELEKKYEEMNGSTYNFYSLPIELSRTESVIPLRLVVFIIELLKGKKEGFEKPLLMLWYMRHKYEKKRRIDAFWEMSDEDLAWVVNNIDKLLMLSKNEVIFCTYVSLLNETGVITLENRIKELFRRMDLEISDKYLKDNDVIFPDINSRYSFITKYPPKERLQYLVKISEREDLLAIKNLEERMLRCELWTCFRSLDDKGKKLLSFFGELGTKEQLVLIATVILLEKDSIYLK